MGQIAFLYGPQNEKFPFYKNTGPDRRRNETSRTNLANKNVGPDRRRSGVHDESASRETGPDRRRKENHLGQIPGITDAIKFDVSVQWETAAKIGAAVAGGILLAEGASALFKMKTKKTKR